MGTPTAARQAQYEDRAAGPEPTFRMRTDLGNAERLADRADGKLLWVFGIGWLWWDGKRWRRDEYALAKLAICDRCGERMYARTSGYKRKDGTQARRYVCANVHFQTGLCDQKPIDAERIDAAVVEYLDRLFIDFDAWKAEMEGARGSQRRALESELEAAETKIEGLRRAEGRIQDRYMALMESGHARKARAVEGALDRAQDERDELENRIRFLRGEIASADELAPTDPMLDAYNELAKAIRGEAANDTMGKLNERLRVKFAEFRLDCMPAGAVGVQPILHGDAVNVGGLLSLAGGQHARADRGRDRRARCHRAGQPADMAPPPTREGNDGPTYR